MVRKSLELMCQERDARGPNLKERLNALRAKVVIPEELFAAMDDLRLLGNDAAHVESKDYENIGKEEVEIGITLAKEILKAAYQYKGLVAKLQSLKKPAK
jgi:hypothetical protein